MEQKLQMVSAAAQIPGLHIVERDPHEDLEVFAKRLSDLFLPGEYAKYVEEFKPRILSSPKTGLFVRLHISPERSLERITNRKTGEQNKLGGYYEMRELYLRIIDRMIQESGVPCISLETGLLQYDIQKQHGKINLLTAFFHGLHNHRFWNFDSQCIPLDTILI